ncbi:MAG: thioredoxin family protein [Hyphomicrobiaceae bacterium]|nr:thioredoxin family protein [Hyphomicrobiaceae bacterium]
MHRVFAIQFSFTIVLMTFFLASTISLRAQTSDLAQKIQTKLIADVTHIVPGRPFKLALHQTLEPKWHTYWKNPGDSGEPIRISWRMPKDFSVSQISWPAPEAISVGHLMNYGYYDEVLLPMTVLPPKDLTDDQVTFIAVASWLVCERICIPEKATLTITLPTTIDTTIAKPSIYAPAFDLALKNEPLRAAWPVSAKLNKTLQLRVEGLDSAIDKISSVRFFADHRGIIDHAASQDLKWQERGFTLTLKPGELLSVALSEQQLSGILVFTYNLKEKLVRKAFWFSSSITPVTVTHNNSSLQYEDHNLKITTLTVWHSVFFAMLGGILLNVMPCVLPILSLKVISFTKYSKVDAWCNGLSYLAGVLICFSILASVLVVLKSIGTTVGWGFQFQTPAFVLAMVALYFILGLSMSGVLDIGTNFVGFGESLTRRPGFFGSFFTGVLATVTATPCTAPFMGASIGYALTQSSFEIFVIFLALGLGFALPVVFFSWVNLGRNLLPVPGRWMQTLKQVMAFPFYGTVIWLVWILSIQIGSDGVLAASILLIGVGLVAWILGMRQIASHVRIWLATVVVVSTIIPLYNLYSNFNRTFTRKNNSEAESFMPNAIMQHRKAGNHVFVNLTAAWCISCKVNEFVALSGSKFETALARYNIVYMKGDWTRQDTEITSFLHSFGRPGVPLYVLYPADRSQKPVILPQILTPSILNQYFDALIQN